MMRKPRPIFWRILIVVGFVVVSNSFLFSQEKVDTVSRAVVSGRWRSTDQPDRYLEFLPNGECRFVVESDSEQCQYGIKYRLEAENDTLYLIRQHASGYMQRHAIRISGDYMVTIYFKTLEGITSNVDEYGVYVRDTVAHPRPFDAGLPIAKFILPKGFIGHVTVAFNQPDGVAPEYDTEGNTLMRIPPSGVIYTRQKEDVFGIAARRFEILMEDSTSGKLVRLPSVDKFELFFATSLPKTTGVVMQGFNQMGREMLNGVLGRSIQGNILMFYVADNVEKVIDGCKNNSMNIFTPWTR